MKNEKKGTARSNPTDTTNTNINNDNDKKKSLLLYMKLTKKIKLSTGQVDFIYQVGQKRGNVNRSKEIRFSDDDLIGIGSKRVLIRNGFYCTLNINEWTSLLSKADKDDAITINEIDGLGLIPSFNCWLFSNACYREDGTLINKEKKETYYKLPSRDKETENIQVSDNNKNTLEVDTSGKYTLDDIKKLIEDIMKAKNNEISFLVILGFIYLSFHSNQIFKEYKYFPILYVQGDRSTGKSSLIRWAVYTFGHVGRGHTATSTPVAVNRVLEKMHSLPVWLDELRHNRFFAQHEENIRRVFDRQVRITGKFTNNNDINEGIVNGTYIVSGQGMITDTATRSRLMAIQLKEKNKIPEHIFSGKLDTYENERKLRSFAPYMLGNHGLKDGDLVQRIREASKFTRSELQGGAPDSDRLSAIYAMAYIGAQRICEILGIKEEKYHLKEGVIELMRHEELLAVGIDTINDFIQTVLNLNNADSLLFPSVADNEVKIKYSAIDEYLKQLKMIGEPSKIDKKAIDSLIIDKLQAHKVNTTVNKKSDFGDTRINGTFYRIILTPEVRKKYPILLEIGADKDKKQTKPEATPATPEELNDDGFPF